MEDESEAVEEEEEEESKKGQNRRTGGNAVKNDRTGDAKKDADDVSVERAGEAEERYAVREGAPPDADTCVLLSPFKRV